MSERTCIDCGETKPLEAFGMSHNVRRNQCNTCRAARYRPAQADANAAMAAYRAGMRKDKCALCASPLDGYGICEACLAAIKVLGDTPEALKQAAKALKWVREQ